MNKTFIDLCCGTGGFSIALEKYNFKCIYANDFEESSKIIYDNNHNIKLIKDNLLNINNFDIPKHDILCAGFPCQGFSISGKRKGFLDKRTDVFWKILDIIKLHTPEIIIFENVKNLLTHDNNKTFEIISSKIKELGYYIKYDILDTSKYTNIPQHRERLYIICFIDKNKYDNFKFDFPIIKNKKITKFLDDNIDEKYYYTDRYVVYDTIKENVIKNINDNTIYQYRRTFIRENKNNVVPTLTANMGLGGHNVPILLDDIGIRKLTPRECFNLQGFPKDYNLSKLSDSKLYKLIGNAITIPIAELIAKKIYELF